MDHGDARDRSAEPGAGRDQHKRPKSDRSGRNEGAGQLEDARGEELASGRELATRADTTEPDQQIQDAEIIDDQPGQQLPLPGFGRIIQYEQHEGPLPSAAQLAEYDRVVPGLARELADAALANMASDRKITEIGVETARTLDVTGLRFAIVLTSVCVVLAAVCLFALEPPWLALSGAGLFGLGACAPVINGFLQRGRKSSD